MLHLVGSSLLLHLIDEARSNKNQVRSRIWGCGVDSRDSERGPETVAFCGNENGISHFVKSFFLFKLGDSLLFSRSLHKGYCFFWDVIPCSSMHIYDTYLLKNHVTRKISKVSSATNVAIVVTSINTEQLIPWVWLHTQLM